MKFYVIAEAMWTRATGDTGSGGLFNSSSPLIYGWYTMSAPQQNWTMPYVVVYLIGSNDEKVFDTGTYGTFYDIQLSCWTAKDTGISLGESITERIRTRFDRWAPTVTGFSVSQLMRQNGTIMTEDRAYHFIEEYRVFIAKT